MPSGVLQPTGGRRTAFIKQTGQCGAMPDGKGNGADCVPLICCEPRTASPWLRYRLRAPSPLEVEGACLKCGSGVHFISVRLRMKHEALHARFPKNRPRFLQLCVAKPKPGPAISFEQQFCSIAVITMCKLKPLQFRASCAALFRMQFTLAVIPISWPKE